MVAEEELTKTEKRMYNLLKTGKFVTNKSLVDCLWDPLSEPETIRYHICNLRRKIGVHGLGIFPREFDGVCGYSLLRRISKRE